MARKRAVIVNSYILYTQRYVVYTSNGNAIECEQHMLEKNTLVILFLYSKPKYTTSHLLKRTSYFQDRYFDIITGKIVKDGCELHNFSVARNEIEQSDANIDESF